MTTYKKVGF